MRPVWKRRLRKAALAAAGFGVLVVALNILADSGWFKRRLVAFADGKLRSGFGLTLRVGDSRVRLGALSVSLRDVQVAAAGTGASPVRSFTASEISVDLGWLGLFKGPLRVQDLRIVRPRLEAAAAEWPSPRSSPAAGAAAKPPAVRKPLALRVDRLTLLDGEAIVEGRARSFAVDLGAIGLTLGYRPQEKGHRGALTCGEGRIGFAGREVRIAGVESEFEFDGDRVGVARFVVRTAGSSLGIKGEVRGLGASPAFEAALEARLDAAEWTRLTPAAPAGRGIVTLEGRAEGSARDVRFSARAESKSLKLEGLPEASFRAALTGTGGAVDLSEFVLDADGGRLEGRGEIRPPGKGASKLDVEWKGLDLGRLRASFPAIPAIGTVANGRIRASWDEWRPASVRAAGRAAFRAPAPPAGESAAAALPVAGDIAFKTSERGVEIERASLRAAGAALSFSGRLGWDRALRARFDAVVDDLGLTLRSAAALGAPLAVPEAGGRVRAEGRLEGALSSPVLRAGVEASGVSWRGLVADRIEAALAWEGRVLEVSKLEARMGEGRLEAHGRVSLANPANPPGRRSTPEGRMVLALTGLPLEALSPLLPESLRPGFGGRLGVALDASGSLAEPRVEFEIKASPLSVRGLRLNEVSASGRAEPGALYAIDEFRIAGDGGAVEGGLSLDRERRAFAVRASTTGLDLAALRALVPGPALSGRVVFDLEGRGPLDAPSGALRLETGPVATPAWSLPGLELRLDADGTTARASASLAGLGVRVEGEVPLRGERIVSGRIEAERIILDRLLPPGTARSGDRPLPLTVDGTFSCPLDDPDGFALLLAFTGFDLGRLSSLSGGKIPPGGDGEVSGWIKLGGNPARPLAMSAEGEIDRLRLGYGGLALENRSPIRFGFRDGAARLDELRLGLADSEIRASGVVRGLPGRPELDARLALDLDASLLPRDMINAVAGGRLKLDVEAEGPLAAPRLAGGGSLASGFFQPDDFPLTVSDAALKLEFRDGALVVSDGRGLANGGLFDLSGKADFGRGFGAIQAGLVARFRALRLNYPPGLQTVSEGRAELAGDGRAWTLSGDVRVVEGSFREDVYPGAELLGFSSLPLVEPGLETPAYYHDFKLDLGVSTRSPLVVRNNMANLEVNADLRVGGTLAIPLLSGRVENAAVGEVVFGERTYAVETARVEFLGKDTASPDVDIVAHTKLRHGVQDLDVRLRIWGTAPALVYDLTSTPPRSREELSLLVLTGKSFDEIRGSALNTLGNQMILYFASPLASPVAAGLRKLLRVDDVSIEPMNIASEADTGARLTLSKKLAGRAALTYSIDISRSQRQAWLVDYGLFRDFSLRAFRKDDGSYGGSLKHSFSLGGRPPVGGDEERAPGRALPLLSGVSAAGTTRLPLERLERAWARLRPGRPYRVSDLGLAADALVELYKKEGYVNASVVPEAREDAAGGVAVLFRVEAGDPAVFVFRGDGLPPRLKAKVRDAWTGKLLESTNLAEGRRIILEALRRDRYYAAAVDAEAVRSSGATTYVFAVARNGRYRIGRFDVEGEAALSVRALRKAASRVPLSGERGLWNLVNQPRLALRAVRNALQSAGYAEALVGAPRIVEDRARRRIDIVLPVQAGPRSLVRSIAFASAGPFRTEELRRALRLTEGRPFAPDVFLEDKTAILNLCHGRGFGGALVDAEARPAAGGTDLDLVYTIREGARHVVGGLEVRGRGRTSEPFVLKTAGLEPGQTFSLERLALAQKRLYDSRAFAAVSVSSRPGAPPGPGADAAETVVIEVRETPPLVATYGVRYNSVEKLEGFAEVGLRNLLGAGRGGLVSYRQNERQRDLRLSLESPSLFGLKVNLLSTFFAKRDILGSFTTDEIGWTVQTSVGLPLRSSLSLLYRLDKVHTYEPEPFGPFPFDISLFLSEVGAVLVRDSRDDRFDPRRGSLLSLALIYSPEALGTELPYVSAFGQAALHLSFGPGIVWATGLRVGLADAYDQVLIPSRRFYAGGGNSIRGFKQDMVGPVDPWLGTPEGGEAVVIFNQELRVPIIRPVSAAVFYDAGNVFATAREVRIADFRHSLGFGLRFASPIGLFRADYGFNLARRPGEPRGVFYLSVGQAF
jgi:outer membrane protein assembly factor BamA/autotransporter translocation and assembly factor TamB